MTVSQLNQTEFVAQIETYRPQLHRQTIGALTSRTVFSGQAVGRWRLLPTGANGQTAFGLYRQTEIPGLHRAYGIQLVTMSDGLIGDIITFINPALFAHFDLPSALCQTTP
jgi:hypothetical protein